MTYSIVARDPDTGELGAAVQTCWPMVGAAVPWVEAGVGAVVTQAATNIGLGPRVLELLREGQDADAAVRTALAPDPEAAVRQLAVVDARGRAAAHTGERTVAEAGHRTATDVSAQGNMLAGARVPEEMLQAFQTPGDDLAGRLLAALQAAEGAGGDIRGGQSAALIVASGGAEAEPWSRRFDLRVDDSRAPLDELSRLLRVARAFEALGTARALAGTRAFEDAVRASATAYELAPDDAQIVFWHGVVLLAGSRTAEARAVLGVISDEARRWQAYAQLTVAAEPDAPLASAIGEASRLLQGGR